jgi:hypothetical protein
MPVQYNHCAQTRFIISPQNSATVDRRGDDRPYPHCEQEALR